MKTSPFRLLVFLSLLWTVQSSLENQIHLFGNTTDSGAYMDNRYRPQKTKFSMSYPTKKHAHSVGTIDGGWGWTRKAENRQAFWQVGPFDFITSIPNALNIIGLGCLWISSLGAGSGFPFVYPVLLPLLLLVALIIVFIPNQELNFMTLIRDIEAAVIG